MDRAVTGGVGVVAVHFLLTVVLAGVLYSQGEVGARRRRAFARRIGGDRAEQMVRLAASAARGVALGVVVTALVQSLLAGLGSLDQRRAARGRAARGHVRAVRRAARDRCQCSAAGGVWLFWSGSGLGASSLAVCTVFVAVIDNVLKPLLIRRGVDLPLLLLIAGVIGGLIGFGVVGLFIGPVILAVTYTLLVDWVREGSAPLAR